MPFIWRTKHIAEKLPNAHPEALSCLDAAYILLDVDKNTEHFSYNLASLLGVHAPSPALKDMLGVFKTDAATRLSQMTGALKQGQIAPSCIVTLEDGSKHFAARAMMTAGMSENSRIGVVWLYDITSENRSFTKISAESEKLKNELKYFSTILNMAPYPIWQRDGEMKIRYYNLAYGEIAEAADGGADESPELDRKARALAQAALSSGEAKRERRYVVVDGNRRLFEINELPIPAEKTVIGFAQDVTEIETLQSELERYISAQSDLLESSASAMAIFGADTRLRSFNYAFVNLWKLDEAWLETQPSFSEILENLRERRKLPEQANFVQFKQQQLKLFTDLIEPREEFFYLPDGRALRVIVIPHALGGLLFAYEDVTDRLTLERSYNTLIAVQRETLDNLHEGVAVFGEDGKLKLSNPVFLSLWGIEPNFIANERHVIELVDHVQKLYLYDDWEVFRAQRIAQIQSRKFERKRMERTDGKVIDCTTVPLPDGATLITYLDVTDSTLVERSLRERNEALQEADRLKSEFLANVSYELRSPLTSISGFSEMLRQEYFGNLTEKQKEYVDGIHQSSQHLMQLVNDILDLASIEAGYLQLDVAKFDVHSMMESVLPLVQERLKEHALTLTFECPKSIGMMLGDETRIRQLLFKLLSNAIKFSPDEGVITMAATAHGADVIELMVKDQGHGIPEEEQQAVFNKFFKGRNKDVPKSVARSGTGLGLSMVKSFVELHGGEVKLQSSTGTGTTILCRLPREHPPLLTLVQAKPSPRKRTSKSQS